MLQKKFNIYLSALFAFTFYTQNIVELSAQTSLHFNITNDDNEGVAFAIIEVPEPPGMKLATIGKNMILKAQNIRLIMNDVLLSELQMAKSLS